MIRIKETLKQKGISQKELADKLGVSAALISRLMDGNPTLKTLLEIAEVLDVRVSELIDEPLVNFFNCPHCGGKIKVCK
jgi:transcriptional regulator with XRE-family HTH domain